MCISSLVVLNGWRRRLHGILYLRISCLHWRHFLYEMDIWLKRGSCRKSKAGQSELGLCKLKLYIVIFHKQISWKSCCELWKSLCNMLHRVILYFLRVRGSECDWLGLVYGVVMYTLHVYIDDTSCTKWIFGWKEDRAEKVKQDSPN
jgi:hypothetical protein